MSSSIGRRLPAFLVTPYEDCSSFQSQSTELVVFSPSAGEYVTIAWPVYHGRRILAHRIRDWLRNRGLHWSCFCSLTFGGSTSARIVEAQSSRVYAFCRDFPSVCGFRIDLTQIHQTARYESEYERLPLLSIGAPDMAILRSEFRSIESIEHGPYFRGYCGEHESEYQGTTQLSGSLLTIRQAESEGARASYRARLDEESRRARASIIPPRRTSSAYTRVRGHSNSTINWSAVHIDNTGPLAREKDIIDRLQAGEGILGGEMSSLFEKCTSCNHYFVASLLGVHIRGCAPGL